MNIIIAGGGTPNRLGNMFGIHAQEQNHNVISLSHEQHPENILETIVCDFHDHLNVGAAFQEAVNRLGTVDLLLYCTRSDAHYHSDISQYSLDSENLDVKQYRDALTTNVIIPHKIMLIAHKLNLPMHIVFFTTHLTLPTSSYKLVGDAKQHTTYIGCKSWQVQLMRGITGLDTSVTASAFAVHFDWGVDNQHKIDHLYDILANHRNKVSGKVISMLELDQVLEVNVLNYAPQLIL